MDVLSLCVETVSERALSCTPPRQGGVRGYLARQETRSAVIREEAIREASASTIQVRTYGTGAKGGTWCNNARVRVRVRFRV